MSGHTPGPWEVARHAKTFVAKKDGRGICTTGCYSDNTKDPCALEAENVANAHIIAAAPELLEALIDAHKLLCYNCQTEYQPECGGFESSDACEASAMTRKAIAKAKGTT